MDLEDLDSIITSRRHPAPPALNAVGGGGGGGARGHSGAVGEEGEVEVGGGGGRGHSGAVGGSERAPQYLPCLLPHMSLTYADVC